MAALDSSVTRKKKGGKKISLSVVNRIRWGSDLCSWVTENILRYVAFWVWIMDRSRAQTVPIREDFIFPIFYY